MRLNDSIIIVYDIHCLRIRLRHGIRRRKEEQMRTYESLVKRINLCESEFNSMDNEQDIDGLYRAFKLMRYMKKSYRTLALNGIKIKEEVK